MELRWKDYLALHAPYVVMVFVAAVSFIYTLGYERGKKAILFAAQASVEESR